ncbi:AAA family ATPase [Chloroflexota bacterium]
MNALHNSLTSAGAPTSRSISRDAEHLLNSLEGPLPEPVLHPVLVVVSGLPGTGKSFFSQRLAERISLLVMESDAMRKALVPSPLHSTGESARLFRAVHEVIDLLLEHCLPVLLDATNLAESHREHLYHIAEQRSARVILVRVKAPPEVVHQRLEDRAGRSQRQDHSDADWEVYKRMSPSQEPVRHNHLVVDTSQDIEPAVQKVVREINRWIRWRR